MNVFCSDCRYNIDIGGEYRENCQCHYPDNVITKYKYKDEYTAFVYDESVKNKNNDCGWFKPKWFKKRKYGKL